MIYGYIIGLRTEITEEEIPVIEDVYITTDVVCSNLDQGEMYNIM
jgi:hypothetical protein